MRVFIPRPSCSDCSSKESDLIHCHEREKSVANGSLVGLSCRQKLPFRSRHSPGPLRYPVFRHRRTGCRYSYSSFLKLPGTLARLTSLSYSRGHRVILSHRDFKFTKAVLLQPAEHYSRWRLVLSPTILVDQNAITNRLYDIFLMSNDPANQKVSYGGSWLHADGERATKLRSDSFRTPSPVKYVGYGPW